MNHFQLIVLNQCNVSSEVHQNFPSKWSTFIFYQADRMFIQREDISNLQISTSTRQYFPGIFITFAAYRGSAIYLMIPKIQHFPIM